MKEINFPCETAVIFRDTIFPIRPQKKGDLSGEMQKATDWFKSQSSASDSEITKTALISFGGLYLDYAETMERAV